MTTLTPTSLAVLELIRTSGGLVVVTIQRGKLAFSAGSASISYHWIESFMTAGLLEPRDPGLIPDTPQSLKLTSAARELLDRAA